MNSKLKVFKYSPVTHIYVGYEDAIPHPITGNYQIPSYTTKLVPPNKRVGYDIVFKEKEGTLPGNGIGEWYLLKQEEITYYNINTLQPITVAKVNEPTINKELYTNISPYDNEYDIYPIRYALIFKDGKWELDLEKLKEYLITILKATRDICLNKPITICDIEYDADELAQRNIQKHALTFGLNVNTTDIFKKDIGITLQDIQKRKIIPWIDRANEVQMVSPMCIIRLHYLIAFREMLIYNMYNELRNDIENSKRILTLKRLIPKLNDDLKNGIISNLDEVEYTEDFILSSTLHLLKK